MWIICLQFSDKKVRLWYRTSNRCEVNPLRDGNHSAFPSGKHRDVSGHPVFSFLQCVDFFQVFTLCFMRYVVCCLRDVCNACLFFCANNVCFFAYVLLIVCGCG
jgi:hypothetical protein